MDESSYQWTVDVETDWGGRTKGTTGIDEGMPFILDCFLKYKISGLFFISTELLNFHTDVTEQIKFFGHEIGSHGHYHVHFKEKFRAEMDKDLSLEILGNPKHYRSPKFKLLDSGKYSNPSGHVGLLKHLWLKTRIPENPIFYLHPFDLVGGKNPPNLFCRYWYSNPNDSRKLFLNLLEKYPK